MAAASGMPTTEVSWTIEPHTHGTVSDSATSSVGCRGTGARLAPIAVGDRP